MILQIAHLNLIDWHGRKICSNRFFRCLSLSGDSVCTATGYWLFLDPSVHAEYLDCDSVVGELLVEHWRHAGQGLHGTPDGPHNDDAECRRQGLPPTGILHQGHWYLDVYVSALRLCVFARVCRGECPLSAQLQSTEAQTFPTVWPRTAGTTRSWISTASYHFSLSEFWLFQFLKFMSWFILESSAWRGCFSWI